MRWTKQAWVPLWVMGLVLGGLQAEATSISASSYQTILDRNAFGLKPMPDPAPPTVVTTPPPAKVNIQLSGISSVGGTKRVWLVIPPGPGRTNTTYLSFAEGDPEREGIRVQTIDPQRGVVEILNAGSPATLDFENYGLAYSGPVAGAAPAQGQPARPGARPAARPTTAPGTPARSATTTPAAAGHATGQAMVTPGQRAAVAAGTGASPTVRTIPSRSVRTASPPEIPHVDPAVQAIQMRANELRARSSGINYPPTPPIPGMP